MFDCTQNTRWLITMVYYGLKVTSEKLTVVFCEWHLALHLFCEWHLALHWCKILNNSIHKS